MRKPVFSAALAVLLAALLTPPVDASSTEPLAPAPTPSAAMTAPTDPDHFEFVVGGDNRSTGHGYPMPPVWATICREIGYLHPAFVLTTGDAVEGYGDTPAEADAEYDVFLKDVALTGVPVYCVPGNHEFSLDPLLLPVYLKRIGKLYGSFDYGHSHFVAVNSVPVGQDGTIQSGTINDAEFAWLQSDLEANKGAANTFVFLHHYVFGPPDPDTPTTDTQTGGTGFVDLAARDRFHALMVKYGVRAVFCGHNHIYWHKVIGGVDYFISGGGGAPLDATPENGGYLHYVLAQVDGKVLTTQVLQPGHLEVAYPEGAAQIGPSQRAWATNTNFEEVTARQIVFHVQSPPPGQILTVTASLAYKKKNKPGSAQIVSQSPGVRPGTVDVVVSATLPKARTAEITVAPAAAKTAVHETGKRKIGKRKTVESMLQ